MKSRTLITKIALGVAIAALIFSIITLIRAIVLGNAIFIACVQVIGTVIIVAICAIMLYVINHYEESPDPQDQDPQGQDPQDESEDDLQNEPAAAEPVLPDEPQPDEPLPVTADTAYDLSLFDEE